MTTPPNPPQGPDDMPPAYGGSGYGMTPPPPGPGAPMSGGQWMGPPLASWGKRVQAALFDYVLPVLVAYIVLFTISEVLGAILILAAIVWAFVQAYQGGATGQSFGKKQAKIRLLGEQTGQPIGGGAGIGRYILHIVDGLPCYIGYLWPLWDAKKQTFADKIIKSVVIDEG